MVVALVANGAASYQTWPVLFTVELLLLHSVFCCTTFPATMQCDTRLLGRFFVVFVLFCLHSLLLLVAGFFLINSGETACRSALSWKLPGHNNGARASLQQWVCAGDGEQQPCWKNIAIKLVSLKWRVYLNENWTWSAFYLLTVWSVVVPLILPQSWRFH